MAIKKRSNFDLTMATDPTSISEIVSQLYPFKYSITGIGNDNALSVLQSLLPFEVFEWPSGSELNGWLIPKSHFVEKALLLKDGKIIYDAKTSPLGLPSQCDSFSGTVSLEELQEHLFSDPKLPEAIPANWTKLYRPDKSLWGFCLPDSLRQKLEKGKYEVIIKTREEQSTMKVLVYTLQGDSEKTILFNAHNCHPFQANDDVSGIATGIALMKRLQNKKNRNYTYQLMIAPELFGPAFWLDGLSVSKIKDIIGTIMLKSVGNEGSLRLQKSFDESSLINRAAIYTFKKKYESFDSAKFRKLYGNDETVFEAPPFRIPSITLTRWPFKEYHTDFDTPEIISEWHLKDCVDTAEKICSIIEKCKVYIYKCRGLSSLSRHNLYLPIVSSEDGGNDFNCLEGRWHLLMNTLPSLLDENFDLLEVSQNFDLPVEDIHKYLEQWVKAGLVTVI